MGVACGGVASADGSLGKRKASPGGLPLVLVPASPAPSKGEVGRQAGSSENLGTIGRDFKSDSEYF